MFNDIVGQENAKNVLGSMMTTGDVPHAFLFVGPYGVGKGETAFETARMLLCEHGPESGCTTCGACHRVVRLEHPDLHILFPFRPQPQKAEGLASWSDDIVKHKQLLSGEAYAPVVYEKGRQIVTGLVSEVREHLLKSSYEGGRKVCVILSADRLNVKTANLLLKILEEPPDDVHFILTTERLSSVLPTIVSRSSVIRFRRLTPEEIGSYLVRSSELDHDIVVSYAEAAGGSIKTAKALSFDIKADYLSHFFKLYDSAARSEPEEIVSHVLPFIWSRDVVEAEEIINGFVKVTQSVLEYRYGITNNHGIKSGYPELIPVLSEKTSISSLNRLSARLEEGLEMLGRNVNVPTVITSLVYGIYDTYR